MDDEGTMMEMEPDLKVKVTNTTFNGTVYSLVHRAVSLQFFVQKIYVSNDCVHGETMFGNNWNLPCGCDSRRNG